MNPLGFDLQDDVVCLPKKMGHSLGNLGQICVMNPYCFDLQDDVVCLPKKVGHSLGNLGQICVCTRVTAGVQVMDPNTLQGK